MGAWLDRLAGPLLDASLAAGLFLGVVSLAMVACRQPARRCWLARAGMLGALAVAPLSWLAAAPRIDLAGPLLAAVPPTWTASPSPDAPANSPRSAPPILSRALTSAYLAGVTLGLAGLILGWWGVTWVEARSAAPSEASRELFDELAAGFPGRRRPRFRVSARIRRPGLLGALRPLLVVPPALDRPEARAALRLCLLHELAHARRRDPLFGQVAALAQALWFPWPQAWWARAQMRLDQEYLTDRLAVAGFGASGAYAASLVSLADPGPTPAGSATGPPGPMPGEVGSRVFRRVLMLVGCPFPVEPTPPLWWRLAIPPLAVAGTLFASGLTVRAIPPPPPAFPAHGAFRLGRLSLPAEPPNRLPPPDPFRLPLRNPPPRYQLTLEAWADTPGTPAGTRILGLALAPGPVAAPAWHAVRILHEPGRVSLWFDDRLVHDRATPPAPDPTPTFQAVPGRPAEFRNLKLTW